MKQGREDQLPWTKWFWADWESDIGLRACGLKAQGLWMRMLSIMARSKKRGYLLDGEKQMESKTLAKLTGESEAEIDSLLDELFSHNVPSKSEEGIIFNRRMVRESELSVIRSEVGRLGGRPRKVNKKQIKSKSKALSASAYASVSASASSSEFEDFWKAYPQDRGHEADALKAFRTLRKKESLETIARAFNGYMDFLKGKRVKENFAQRPMYASTFLQSDRWREYLDYKYEPGL
jgi:hypothetical protein